MDEADVFRRIDVFTPIIFSTFAMPASVMDAVLRFLVNLIILVFFEICRDARESFVKIARLRVRRGDDKRRPRFVY